MHRRPRRPGRGRVSVLALAASLLAAALFAAAPLASPASAQAAAQQASDVSLEKVASVEGITEYRLSNGLRVLLFPDPSKATTTVNVTYFVGSGHEGYGETGMAHLLEHMVFKGTPDHPNIPQELTDHGARPNGTTWFDRTNYYETFQATDENLEWALDLESDRMVNSTIAAEDLESEMTVVRNEFEAGENSPFRVLLSRTQSTAFRWHNYGNSTIGARSDIENVPVERLRAFYRKYYQPDNAMLVVAGKFDQERVLELVEEKFGAIPAPDRSGDMKIYPLYTREPMQEGPREVVVEKVGDVQQLAALYHVPAGSHPDYPAIDLLNHILTNEPSGRLYKALVETGKAASVNALDFQLRDPGALIIMARVREEDSLEEAEEALLAAIEELRENPPTQEEVERAKADRLKSMRLLFNDSESMARNLSEWAATGDWRLFFIHRDRVKEVTPDEVAQAVRDYLIPSNRTLGFFLPTDEPPKRAEIPEAPDVQELASNYEGSEETAAGEAFEPTPENIEARVVRGTVGPGIEYALLPKKSRGERVVARFSLRLGDEESLQGAGVVPELAADMLMRGTERRSRQEIQDRLDELQANVNIFGGVPSVGGFIETTRENFPEVLRLVGEVLRMPAFDAEEFEKLKEETLAQLESQRSQPTARGSRAFGRHLDPWPQGHPSYTPTIQEEIAAVREASLEEVEAFYRRFYGAGAGEVAAVGDLDPGSVVSLLDELFGGWEAEVAYERYPTPAKEVEPADIEIETPDKANAFYLAGLSFPMRDDHPDYPALVLGNFMMGGGFLNSRLATRLRQQDGVSYGTGSQFSAHALDEDGGFVVFAIYAPQNKAKVEAGVREEIQRVLDEGFSAEEVAKAKEGWLGSQKTTRADERSLAFTLANYLFADRTMEWDAELERKVQDLTVEEINEAFREHIHPDDLVVVKAGDFAGAQEAGDGTDAPDGGTR